MEKRPTKVERAILLLVDSGYAVQRVHIDPLGAPPPAGAVKQRNYTIKEFCAAYRVSRSLFYQLRREGKGPEIARAGRRGLISHDAAEAWNASMRSDRG